MNPTKLSKKFWLTMVIFGLTGQVAWVVENMYLNVFIYKMFHASAANISMMVAASAVTATITTLLIGALSDRVGKRKIFICGGYILWGISILLFCLIRMDILTALTGSVAMASSLGVLLVIIMDCVMTFFGSSANDACFNAWLTDSGDDTNRGKIEGINSMMPLIAILAVFGGFMFMKLDLQESWTKIFLMIGLLVILIGIAGCFLIRDVAASDLSNRNYWKNVCYSFRPSVYRENKLLYKVVAAFAVFGISIQIFMPYLILYYEKALGMKNYVLIMAPAILLASLITSAYGKLYDSVGFRLSVIPTVVTLMIGYAFLFFFRGTMLVFLGSLLMMTGYLTGMAVFGAMIRDNTPRTKTGLFQGLRIFGQVFIPGIVGPFIGARVLRHAKTVENQDGTTSFIPNQSIFLAAFIVAALLFLVLGEIFRMIRISHYDTLTELGEEEQKKWAEGKIPWTVYPRPQMKRDSYFTLNGKWKLNHHTAMVPFSPQSQLSAYQTHLMGFHFTYERTFRLPKDFYKTRVLLHFGAADQIAEVYINNQLCGKHTGGYLPFTFDITKALNQPGEENMIHVKVTDTLSETYPYGKQRMNRGGMWYTPVSGIWQSVWLESVPDTYIEKLVITPNLTGIELNVLSGGTKTENQGYQVTIPVQENEITIHGVCGQRLQIDLKLEMEKQKKAFEPKLWTPDTPYLYDMEVSCGQDCVTSYFALRTITIEKKDKIPQICLNGKPIFLHAVLDQGYYSDGHFLPAGEKGYTEDILAMKKLGFNTLRKHTKIEPETFYYDCDRYGMLVMQDMVNSGHYSFIRDTALPSIGNFRHHDHLGGGSKKRKQFFVQHTMETVRTLYNHPCIVYYTIFNEGWGQFDSDALYETVKNLDSTRIIDSTSGWFFGKKTDVKSLHIYFNNKEVPLAKSKPTIVSECGGYSYEISDHFYCMYSHYGYGNCDNSEELTKRITDMYQMMILPAIGKGLCGCVYTQLSDVEDEINGLLTYDRRIIKADQEPMKELGRKIRELTG